MILFVSAVDLDVDPILRASGAFRLLMSSFGSEGNFENETEQAIKALSADYSDFVIYCNFEGRQCNERYAMFLQVVLVFYYAIGHIYSIRTFVFLNKS